MKTYFDEKTDKRLLEAKTKEEVMAIIAGTPEAEKLADKADEIMAEIARIRGDLDEEVDIDELDSAAGGAKRQDIYLSETQSCIATFRLEDQVQARYCVSNDQCWASNEYKYHNTRYSNCRSGGRHDWVEGKYLFYTSDLDGNTYQEEDSGYKCSKCGYSIKFGFLSEERFND